MKTALYALAGCYSLIAAAALVELVAMVMESINASRQKPWEKP